MNRGLTFQIPSNYNWPYVSFKSIDFKPMFPLFKDLCFLCSYVVKNDLFTPISTRFIYVYNHN